MNRVKDATDESRRDEAVAGISFTSASSISLAEIILDFLPGSCLNNREPCPHK
jgi:hypothetical protein